MLIPNQISLTQKQREVALHLLSHFKVDGKRADEIVTEGQLLIFASIVFRLNNRIEIICSTQYGKSLFVALATVVMTCLQGAKIAIVAPGQEQAKIIMRYYIEHLGDHKIFVDKLEYEDRTNYNRLRKDMSKTRITLNNGGFIYVLSAQSKFISRSITAAMGQGAEVVIEDESCLISDNSEATIFRMISGKNKRGMYVKIGNPWERNHFWRDWNKERYLRIFIDYKQGIAEGRYDAELIEEARDKPFFDILYGCQFPPEDEIDEKGFRQLMTTDDIKYGELTDDVMVGEPKLGGDIGGGGDKNVYVIRYPHYSFIAGYNQSRDTMTNVTEVINLIEKYKIPHENVNLDDIGIGRGVVDRLKELGYNVNGVTVGSKSKEELFSNLKSEIWWKASKWVKDEKNHLQYDENWQQLTWIKFKVNSDKVLQIEPKDELKKRTGKSPDFAEAFSLTFYESEEQEFNFTISVDSIYDR